MWELRVLCSEKPRTLFVYCRVLGVASQQYTVAVQTGDEKASEATHLGTFHEAC